MDINQLYQKLLECSYQDMYKLEMDFFMKLSYDFSKKRLPWMTAFLIISTWFGTSMRNGVWTFYETGNLQEMEITLTYLRESGDMELAEIFEKGIHDYQNPQYALDYDYPKEWLEEADKIDDWILKHEDNLWKWEYDILMMNKASLLNE